MSRTLTITSAAMPDLLGAPALVLRRIDGGEALSTLFSYNLVLSTPDNPLIPEHMAANVDFKKLIGKEVTVQIALDGMGFDSFVGSGMREISGLVTRARFVRLEDRRGIYEAVLEPWLSLATRTSDYRIYQGMSALDIVLSVLAEYSFPTVKRTSNSYPKKDFQVQYGETDFDFVSRLMEEWGMYYFFEHAGGKHRLVIVDESGAHLRNENPGYQRVSYYPPGHKIDEEHLNHVDFTESLQTGVWVTDDYDFKKPKARLQQKNSMPRNTGHKALEMYSWPSDIANQNQSTDPEEGRFLTRIRMEAAGAAGQRASASGNLRGMVCGTIFTLGNYPQERYDSRDYLIIGSTLSIHDIGEASGQGDYECRSHVVFQPAEHVYRPEQTTPIPRTTGPQTAVITGPAGREIYTDSYGRVKLSFHWNRYCSKDENASCWVRVNYPWAGNNFGGIQIPRIGQEVIVDFENGSPDRPIVTGRVYNALNMPPWDLPANQTQSGLLTRSSEGGGSANANALRFEDKKGQEEVWLHAEKDQRIEVENDESHWVGHDRTKTIDHDETNHIKNDRTETVDGHEKITVHKTRTETVDLDETLTVHKNQTFTVDLDRTKHIGVNESDTIGSNWTIKTGKMKNETIGIGYTQTTGAFKMVNIGAAYNLNVGGAMMTNVGLARMDNVGLSWKQNTGKSITITAGDSIELICGASVLKMTSDGSIYINGKTIDLVASTHMGLESERIDIN